MDLSVVIACHNEAATVGAQLDAIARQKWTGNWEVIVVDNGSSDGTGDVARQCEALRHRMRVVLADSMSGAAYARHVGVEMSDAPLLLFCDGDDVVADGWLAALADALQSHPLVSGDTEIHKLNHKDVALTRGPHVPGTRARFGDAVVFGSNNGGMWRSVWDELGGFDVDFGGLEDIELSLRAAALGYTVGVVPEAIVHYRYRSDWKALARQGYYYGQSVPRLAQRSRSLGLQPPPRWAGGRSWVWLIINIPRLQKRSVRLRWLWTACSRTGVLLTSLRMRSPMI